MKRIIIQLFKIVGLANVISAQKANRPDTYNCKRATEAIQNNNIEEALEYLNKELKDNPNNGYALARIAYVRLYQKEYGSALTAVNMAIENIPKKNKYRTFAYVVRAKVYVGLGENEKALADFTSAIKKTPDDAYIYEQRAYLYYQMKKYGLADEDYRKVISIDPGNVIGYMGIGWNANAEKRYDDAIEQFNYVIKLASDYSLGYSFRAESYMGLKQYDKAIDDIIKALEIDADKKAFYLMTQIADSVTVPLIAKLKVQSTKNPNDDFWPYCLGVVHEHTGAYKKAIKYYSISHEKDLAAITAFRISICYSKMGDFNSALKYIDNAITLDSTNHENILAKANILYDLGKPNEAIAELSKYINLNPDSFYGYYQRGFFKDNIGDVDGAIEDYSTAIYLEPSYAYAYCGRGDMNARKGDKNAAISDYQKVIQLDTVPANSSCAQYAYLQLGKKEEAIAFMDRVIAQDTTDAGNYYDAACLYSRMGELEKSIEFLQTAFEKGYRRFAHLEMDDDLDAIREVPKYKELIQQYKNIFETEIEDKIQDTSVYKEQTVEIPFGKEDDICKVKCAINNLPLYFVFDTGASDVSISSVEATFMMKNGYLKSTDVIGKQNYRMANGEISAGTVINLRNVNFGGLNLDNVRASVVHNQTAPLLLGQSVLNRLGSIEIDNVRKVLKITYQKKVEDNDKIRNQ